MCLVLYMDLKGVKTCLLVPQPQGAISILLSAALSFSLVATTTSRAERPSSIPLSKSCQAHDVAGWLAI